MAQACTILYVRTHRWSFHCQYGHFNLVDYKKKLCLQLLPFTPCMAAAPVICLWYCSIILHFHQFLLPRPILELSHSLPPPIDFECTACCLWFFFLSFCLNIIGNRAVWGGLLWERERQDRAVHFKRISEWGLLLKTIYIPRSSYPHSNCIVTSSPTYISCCRH